MLVLGGIAIAALTLGRSSDVASVDPTTTLTTLAPTTETEVPKTTATTEAEGYTTEMETTFVDACVAGPSGGQSNNRLLCRCVFTGIREQIAFERFVEIEKEVGEGTDLSTTEIQPIISECAIKHPATGGDESAPS